MIVILGAPLSTADSFTVSGSIILRDESGDGIQKVEIRDRFGVGIHSAAFDCPVIAEVHLERVARGRLPLHVEGTSCKGETSLVNTPVWVIGVISPEDPSIPLPGDALLCSDNPSCRDEEGATLRARNEVIERCNNVRAVRGRRDAAAAAAAVLAAAVVALVAAGVAAFAIPFFGGAIGAILLGLAAGLAYMAVTQALVAAREHESLNNAETELAAARRRFTEAADRANMLCGRDCRTVDLNQPEC